MSRDDTARVLVVEDEPDLREALCDALAAARILARGVGSGAEAIDELTFEPLPDAVVLDLRLPVRGGGPAIDGWALLDWLRREGGLRHLPVVIVSGAPLEHVELAASLGVAACLRKPVRPVDLLQALLSALGAEPRKGAG
jgi:CheY-like chemotaxis protein